MSVKKFEPFARYVHVVIYPDGEIDRVYGLRSSAEKHVAEVEKYNPGVRLTIWTDELRDAPSTAYLETLHDRESYG